MKQLKRFAKLGALAVLAGALLSGCIFIFGDQVWSDWDADLKIVAEWDDDYYDLDLYVSYPDPIDENTTNDSQDPEFIGLYDDLTEVTSRGGGGDAGFFLEDSATYREIVSPSNQSSTITFSGVSPVQMTDEGKNGGPEVVIIRRPPFFSSNLAFATSPDNSKGLSTAYTQFAWIGVGEVYVDGDSGQLVSSGGSSANVQVSIYDDRDDLLGRFTLPENMDLTSMSIARIHYFVADDGLSTYNYYVIVPDQRTMLSTSDFRSVSGHVTIGDGAIGVVGTIRD